MLSAGDSGYKVAAGGLHASVVKMMRYSLLVVLALGAVAAEDIPVRACVGVTNEHCNVTQLRIDPCKEVPSPCRLKKKTDATVAFDFTPDFSAATLKTGAYWANGLSEPKFAELAEDACLYTACPSNARKSQTYSYSMHVGKQLPPGTYPIKWKVWNAENEEQVCCFMISVKIVK